MQDFEYEWKNMPEVINVFPYIYEKSYKEHIVALIMGESKFGRYKKEGD